MAIDFIIDQITKLWEEYPKRNRIYLLRTGKAGAIEMYVSFEKELRPLSASEESEMRAKLKAELKDGMYEIGGDDQFIKYLG